MSHWVASDGIKAPHGHREGHTQKRLFGVGHIVQGMSMSDQRSTRESISIEAVPLSRIMWERVAGVEEDAAWNVIERYQRWRREK